MRYQRYRPPGDRHGGGEPDADIYEACVDLSQNSWQGKSRTGSTLSHGAICDFVRDAHRVAARAGAVDVHLLRLNERPVAFAYNYHLQGYVYGLRMGFDANVSRDGAGVVLLRRAIEASFASGDHTYDLGPDYLCCKRHWLSRVVHSQRCCHYAWSAPRAQALRLKRAVQGWLVPAPSEPNFPPRGAPTV